MVVGFGFMVFGFNSFGLGLVLVSDLASFNRFGGTLLGLQM